MRVGMCRFSEADKTNFDALFKSEHFAAEKLQQLRSGACADIGPPIEAEMELLESMDIWEPQQPPPTCLWSSWMAHHRDFMRSCIIRIDKA